MFSSIGASTGQFSKHLRTEYGPRGVRVHHVSSIYTAGSFFAASNYGATKDTSDHHDVLMGDPEPVFWINTEHIASEVGFMTSLPTHVNLASVTVRPLGNR